MASKALSVDATNVKALYHRALAHKLGDEDSARDDLKLALKYDPENSDVKRELISIKRESNVQKTQEKTSLQKAFFNSGPAMYLYK